MIPLDDLTQWAETNLPTIDHAPANLRRRSTRGLVAQQAMSALEETLGGIGTVALSVGQIPDLLGRLVWASGGNTSWRKRCEPHVVTDAGHLT